MFVHAYWSNTFHSLSSFSFSFAGLAAVACDAHRQDSLGDWFGPTGFPQHCRFGRSRQAASLRGACVERMLYVCLFLWCEVEICHVRTLCKEIVPSKILTFCPSLGHCIWSLLQKPAGRRGGVAFCERSENLGVWGVAGAKPEQNLEMGGGEGCAGAVSQCRNWATVGYRFPAGPFLVDGLWGVVV